MLRRTLGITLSVALVLSAAAAWAADERGPRPRAKDRLESVLAQIKQALKLDDEKLVQVEQVLRTHAQAIKNWHSEHGEELKGVQGAFDAARKDRDREKLKAVVKQRAELMAGLSKIQAGLATGLGDVLTKEQIEKIMPLIEPRQRRGGTQDPLRQLLGALGRLNLTEKQRAAVREILGEYRKASAATSDPKAKAKLATDVAEKIIKTVLTEQQREALAKMKQQRAATRGNPFASLNLTGEQNAAIKKINETFAAAMKTAKTPEERREAMKARGEQTRGVLTEEQLDTWRKQMRERSQRARGGGEGRAPREGDRKRPPGNRGGNRPRPE